MPVRLSGATSGYVELAAPAVAGTTVLELPTDSIKPGLVLVAASTFSAAASVSVDDCFSSDYDAYWIVSYMTVSASAEVRLRYRAAGADDTSSAYDYATTTAAFLKCAYAVGGDGLFLDLRCHGPALARSTHHLQVNTRLDTKSQESSGGRFTAATAFDGFTIYPQFGTITGSISVYAYRKDV